MAEHDGHRKRMIEKLQAGRLCAHEYLEVLLFNAMPRKNTNDLAHRLLAKFGSVSGVFQASVLQLCEVDGVGESLAAYICCVGRCMQYYVNEKIVNLPKHFSAESFLSFVKEEYARETKEVLDMYFIDGIGCIYKKKSFTSKSLYNVIVSPEALTQSFRKEHTSGIVLVHNHVSGDMTPSQKDDETTLDIWGLCVSNDVMFCDHIIYCPRGMYSYMTSGRMQSIMNKGLNNARNE